MSERRTVKPARKPIDATRPPARAAGFTLDTRWVAIVFGLLVVLFFHDVVVGGKTFVSPDTTAPAGFVRMGEQALYHDHYYPLWNPYVFLGMPSFASGAYNPLIYPPDWPLALVQKVLPFLPDLTWMLLYYFLGGVFMFLLARDWGARPEGALLAAVAYVFAPNLIAVGSHGHGSQLVDSMYLPLMMWLGSRWMQRGRLTDLGWLAIAGGFQLLRGHVQICFYTWMALGLYTVAELIASIRAGAVPERLARAGGMLAAALLAFGIAGFYNLPLRDYAQYSIRGGTDVGGGVGQEYATAWSFALYELPSIVVPGWAGFGGQTYWGGMPFTDYPNAFVGIVTVVLALCAGFAVVRRRAFVLVLAVFALLVAFGKNFPLYGVLYGHLPLFNKFRIPVMIVLLFQLAAALGLAWGWSAVLELAHGDRARRERLAKLLLAMAAVLAIVLVAGVFGQDLWRSGYIANAMRLRNVPGLGYTPELGAQAYTAYVGDLGRACLLGLLAIGAAWLALRGRLAPRVASLVVLGLLMVELWPVSGRLMAPVIGDPVQRNAEQGRDDVTDFLVQAGPPGTFRVLPVEEFQNNRFAGFGIASVGGYHAAKPRRIQDFMDYGANRELVFDPRWMRLLNVRFIVTHQKLEPAPPYLKLVHEGSALVYENLSALPRATLVGNYRVVTPAKAILDSVRNGSSDSALLTYLEQDPKLTLGPLAGPSAAVVSRYRLNDVTVDVDTPAPALLRLADAWYPDWVATVDGHAAPLYAADYLLRAVPVPAGKHQVRFTFQSKAVGAGLLVSIASCLISLGLLIAGMALQRRRESSPPGAVAAAAAPGA